MSDPFCSTLSLEAGEPLAGTAVSETDRYLVLEHEGTWGPKGVDDSGLPEPVVARLGELTQRHSRLRVQLVRGGARAPNEPLRLYLAESGERPALYRVHLTGLEQLLELDLDGWLRGALPAPGEREETPLYLVCAHGKRDRCCALLGLPVHRALAERVGERALQTTHLGGHRFAATLLTLPDGICYGRVQADEVPQLIEACQRGEIYDLSRVRGRTVYPPEAQAAEVMLRERLGDLRIAALSLREIERPALERYRVRFVGDAGVEHTVELERAARPALATSCGAVPKPISVLLRALPPA